MLAAGINHDRVAFCLGISDVTFRKHYRDEIDNAEARAHHAVGLSLLMQAVGGPRQDWRKAVTSATIFYAKTRMGFHEPKQEIGLCGDLRLESLTDRQIDILLERIVARRRRESAESGAPQAQGRGLWVDEKRAAWGQTSPLRISTVPDDPPTRIATKRRPLASVANKPSRYACNGSVRTRVRRSAHTSSGSFGHSLAGETGMRSSQEPVDP
jgi:hypothetical protein